jgi:hypothetical protein
MKRRDLLAGISLAVGSNQFTLMSGNLHVEAI